MLYPNYNLHHIIGIWFHESGIVGPSPDGFVQGEFKNLKFYIISRMINHIHCQRHIHLSRFFLKYRIIKWCAYIHIFTVNIIKNAWSIIKQLHTLSQIITCCFEFFIFSIIHLLIYMYCIKRHVFFFNMREKICRIHYSRRSSVALFFLVDDQGKLSLRVTHDYWHQIQGQLHLTNTECCDLVVWTTKDLQIIRILKDKSWVTNITTMLDFYFTIFLKSHKEIR